MSNTRIKCTACQGTGKAKLGQPLQEVVDSLKHNGPMTARELCDHLNIVTNVELTAVYRRVERLMALRIVKQVQGTPARFAVV